MRTGRYTRTCRLLPWLPVAACVLLSPPWAQASWPSSVPPLSPPSGAVIRVRTEPELRAAVAGLTSGKTVLIAPGTYHLTSTLYVKGPLSNVAIRGDTANRDDVQIVGPGMTNRNYGASPFGIWTGFGVRGILIANLTIRDFYFHPIILNPDTSSPRVYNVRAMNGGEQLLKSNPDGKGQGIDRGIVEYSAFEFTATSRDDYTNAIDVHAGSGWVIRNNLFRNIRAPRGQLAGPAILMWRGSKDTVVERNTFIDCQREIAFGLDNATALDHSGGVIQNNFIVRDARLTNGDAAITINSSPNSRVQHNSILISGTFSNAIEFRFPGTIGAVITNNLTDAPIQARDGATATVTNNYTAAQREFFAAPASGDLHLTANATAAIGKASAGDVSTDWDGETRPVGSAPDLGADEFNPGSSAPAVGRTGSAVGGSELVLRWPRISHTRTSSSA